MPLVLLTGSSGFVGATVLAHLIQYGHAVIAIVRSTSSADRILSTHPEWEKMRNFRSGVRFYNARNLRLYL